MKEKKSFNDGLQTLDSHATYLNRVWIDLRFDACVWILFEIQFVKMVGFYVCERRKTRHSQVSYYNFAKIEKKFTNRSNFFQWVNQHNY